MHSAPFLVDLYQAMPRLWFGGSQRTMVVDTETSGSDENLLVLAYCSPLLDDSSSLRCSSRSFRCLCCALSFSRIFLMLLVE